MNEMARREGEKFEDYKARRRIVNKRIAKHLRRGRMIWNSSLHPTGINRRLNTFRKPK